MLKNLSETDDDNERLVRVAIQKRKVFAANTPAPKKANKAQPTTKPRAFVLPSSIPWGVKTRTTKDNPKIGNKE